MGRRRAPRLARRLPALTYVSAGYTEATFGDVNYSLSIFPNIGTSTGLQLPERAYRGWFVGGGVEYALGWLPGLFWKTEYRFADYRARTDNVIAPPPRSALPP